MTDKAGLPIAHTLSINNLVVEKYDADNRDDWSENDQHRNVSRSASKIES